MRFLGIILRFLRLEVSVYNDYITKQFKPTFAGGGGGGLKSISIGDLERQGGKLLRLLSQSRPRIRPLLSISHHRYSRTRNLEIRRRGTDFMYYFSLYVGEKVAVVIFLLFAHFETDSNAQLSRLNLLHRSSHHLFSSDLTATPPPPLPPHRPSVKIGRQATTCCSGWKNIEVM